MSPQHIDVLRRREIATATALVTLFAASLPAMAGPTGADLACTPGVVVDWCTDSAR